MLRTCTALLLLFIFTSFSAQEKGFSFGLEGGFGPSDLRGYDLHRYHRSMMGNSSGLFIGYSFGKTVSLRTGAYYELKGTAYKITSTDSFTLRLEEARGRYDFRYLTIPLLLRAGFGKKLRGFVNAGPYLSLLLNQAEVSLNHDLPRRTDQTAYFKKADAGVSFGLGLSYSIKRVVVSMEARNNLGVYNINKSFVPGDQRIQTKAFNILLGIGYQLSKRKPAEKEK